MSRKLKMVLIIAIVTLVTVIAENIAIDVFVAKNFTEDLFGFRDFIVSVFQLIKLAVNGLTVYFAYAIYKMLE